MSAFMVNDDTLDLLASVASWSRDGLWVHNSGAILPPRGEIKYPQATRGEYLGYEDMPAIKEELRLENIASLRARYKDADSMLGDRAPFKRIDKDQATFAQVLGALACYEYQACESENWLNSYAYAICASIRRHICNLISNGNWEYERPAGMIQRVSLMDMLKD